MFGARLDSIADRVFVFVILVKLAPEMPLQLWMMLWLGVWPSF